MSAFEELGSSTSHEDVFTTVDERRSGHVWLLYGGQGVGKTYTAMSFPEPVFLIDTEMRADITAPEYADRDIRIYEPSEINFEDVDPDNPLDDAIDIEASLDNINNAVVSLVNGYRDDEIEGGTVILDSVTDLWDWAQEWGKLRLIRKNDVDESNFRLENQFDWGFIKSKHNKILTALRTLSKNYGVQVVLTARENKRPDYAEGGGEHYIKCEKSVPFWAEVTARFTKDIRKGQQRHVCTFDKLGSNNQPTGELIDPTYEEMANALEVGEIPDSEPEAEDEDGGF